jgi:hypothetical protein
VCIGYLKSIALGVLGYQVGLYLAVWGESQSYYLDGVRMDRGEFGENLWLRNRLRGHGLLLAILFATTAILVEYILRRRYSPTPLP